MNVHGNWLVVWLVGLIADGTVYRCAREAPVQGFLLTLEAAPDLRLTTFKTWLDLLPVVFSLDLKQPK